MKIKTMGRLAGAVNAGIGVTLGVADFYLLANSNYDLVSLLSSDFSNSYKAFGAGFQIFLGIYLPLLSLLAADGLTDVAKGTHHYFGCRVWQKLTRNPEMKTLNQLLPKAR